MDKTSFFKDNSEKIIGTLPDFISFCKEREETATWYTDETGCEANGIRLQPIYAEPILIAAEVAKLKAAKYPKFVASEEAYTDTMNSPDDGYDGSSQIMLVKGNLYPVGNSAIKGMLSRLSIGLSGWNSLKEFSPKELSDAINHFFKARKGNLCILVQDEKVRSVRGGTYAICPISFVAQETQNWIDNEKPLAKFNTGLYTHDYAHWEIDLSAYTNDILKAFPALINQGFKPGAIIQTSNTGANSVSLKPALCINGTYIALGNNIDAPHIAKGTASERTTIMKERVTENFKQLFVAIEQASSDINKLRNIKVSNASNAILRGMKAAGLPLKQSMEAVEGFNFSNGGTATAYECFLAIVDAFCFIVRDFPTDYQKQFAAADSVARSIRFNWKVLGEIPGNFIWEEKNN